MTETERAYLAGLFDGEGHLGITLARPRLAGRKDWRTHVLIMTIANTHMDTMTWLQASWPKGTLVIRQQATGRIPVGYLRWTSAGARTVLLEILPYLRIKKPQALLALRFVEEMAERPYKSKTLSEEEWLRREDLRIAIRHLNRPDPTLKVEPFPGHRFQRGCSSCAQKFTLMDGSRMAYCSPECQAKGYAAKAKERQLAERT
mgnify:CR=1 FL=1